MEYYIFATNNCNLNCQYCSVLLKTSENNIPLEPVYSLEALNTFIHNTQVKLNDTHAELVFFGGEPTLNYPFIRDVICSQCIESQRPYTFTYVLHTNGLELGNIPNDILSSISAIMLSINYDKIPHNHLNEGYFRVVADAIMTIRRKKQIPIIGRMTITEETSLFSEIALLNGFFDAIYWQIENCYQFKNFNQFYESYKYELTLVFNSWLKYLERGFLLNYIPFIASASFANNKEKTSDFCCGYNRSMIYVQTNGDCYTCAEDMTTKHNLVGSIESGFQFDGFGFNDTKCLDCKYVQICKGRCGRMHREFDPSHTNEYCMLNKIMFDLILENLPLINKLIKKWGLSIAMEDPIFHYTEYTP